MTDLTCCNCGIAYSVPDHWCNSRREDKRDFYCPNGHPQAFVKSRADVLIAEKAALELKLQAELNSANHLRLVAEKALETERRNRRRIEKRIAAGVCPCCNRQFQDLHRHMTTKHKGYSLPPASPLSIAAKAS